MIKELKNRKYKLYLLSNKKELHYRYIANKFSIVEEFDEHCLSYKFVYMKPDSKIFQAVLKKSKLPANNHIYIDDKEEYVNAAKSIGMAGIVFKSVDQLKNALKEMESYMS